MKLCKDCDHYRSFYDDGPKCSRIIGTYDDPVIGPHPARMSVPAYRERKRDTNRLTGRQRCGPSGRFFTPIENLLP